MTEKKISRRSRKRPPPTPPPSPYPRVFEAYRDPYSHNFRRQELEGTAPNCINGDVEIRRYEITVRRIEEPVEVLRERLLKLWHESERNHHSWDPMWSAARDLGVESPRDFLKLDEQGRDHKRGPR